LICVSAKQGQLFNTALALFVTHRPSGLIFMTLQKHDLHAEFPEFSSQIHDLKISSAHFAKLFDEYHEVDHEVRRIENGVENTSDTYLEDKKKARLHLKDQLFKMIKDQVETA
jgi:uncharacterized protein YdcH (DUF465 family)